jgi:hypothetical protein
MTVSVELRILNHAIDDLRSAVTSLSGKYGNVPTVARLRNDLDRLILDAGEVETLPPEHAAVAAELLTLSDEPYDPAMWSDDADDEGLGGFHGGLRHNRR